MAEGCVYCTPLTWNGEQWHDLQCPQVTTLYPAKPGQVCTECGDPVGDTYTTIRDGRIDYAVCIPCAILVSA